MFIIAGFLGCILLYCASTRIQLLQYAITCNLHDQIYYGHWALSAHFTEHMHIVIVYWVGCGNMHTFILHLIHAWFCCNAEVGAGDMQTIFSHPVYASYPLHMHMCMCENILKKWLDMVLCMYIKSLLDVLLHKYIYKYACAYSYILKHWLWTDMQM